MDIQDRDNRFFGILGLIMTVCGLTLPYLINAIASDEQAGGFLITSLILALVFSIMGRKSKPGLVALLISGICTVFVLVLILIKFG